MRFFVLLAQLRDWTDISTDPNGCMVDNVPTLKCLEVVFGNMLILSSSLFALGLFIMFVIGAFNYLTSLGSPEKLKKAQATLRYAILGTVLFVLSFTILTIIDKLFLGGQGLLFKFKIPGPND